MRVLQGTPPGPGSLGGGSASDAHLVAGDDQDFTRGSPKVKERGRWRSGAPCRRPGRNYIESSDALASRLEGCVLIDVTTRPSGRDASGKVRLALRWMLILATALLLSPPGARPLPQGFD